VDPLAATAVPDIDVTSPHPARMYDYYLGGKGHWAADREAAEHVLAVAEVPAIARANRAFLRRAVRHLARDKGKGGSWTASPSRTGPDRAPCGAPTPGPGQAT